MTSHTSSSAPADRAVDQSDPNTDGPTSDREALRRALAATPRFVYGNAFQLVVVSVAWVIASLPLVTIGPATLAAYVAILGLKSDVNRIDRGQIVRILRSSGLSAALFAGVPVILGLASVSSVLTFVTSPSLVIEVAALLACYGAVYIALALIPTFVFLAEGDDDLIAFKQGIAWTAAHPTLTLVTGLLTICLFSLTVLLTIAFVLLFAGVTFSVQIAIVRHSLEMTRAA